MEPGPPDGDTAPATLAEMQASAFTLFFGRLTDFSFKFAVYAEHKLPQLASANGPVAKLTEVYEGTLLQDEGAPREPVQWRGAEGSVPRYNVTQVHEVVMLRTGRFEKKLADAFPRPYSQFVGSLWTYAALLGQIASNPDPKRFNQTGVQLVRLYFDSAKGFEGAATRLFGPEFAGEQRSWRNQGPSEDPSLQATNEILRWFPKLVAEALLKSDHAYFSAMPGAEAGAGAEGGGHAAAEVDAAGRSSRATPPR
eukprot:g671.t1